MTMFRLGGDAAAGITRGFNTLAESLFPNPAREAQALYYASGARHNTARAADQELVTEGRRGLSGVFAGGGDPRAAYAQAALAGADVMNVLPGTMLGYRAALPDATPEGLANLQLGARMAWNQTAPGAREHEAAATQRSHITAGPGYASVAENRRQWNETPVTMMGSGSVPIVVRRSDVVAGRMPEGAAPLVTEDQVQGNVASRLAQGQDVPNAPLVLAPAQVAANQGQIARDGLAQVMVVGPQGVRTTTRAQVQPGEVIVPNNDPADAAATAALAGQPIPADRIAAAAQAAQAMTPARAGGQPRTVGALEAQRLGEEIRRQVLALYGAADIDPGLLSRLTAQASAAYQATGNSAAAIEEIMRPIRLRPPGFELRGGWLPWASGRVQERAGVGAVPPVVERGAAAPQGLVPAGRAPDGRTVYGDSAGRLYAH